MTGRASYTIQLPRAACLVLGARTLIMAIVNVTPDSFAGGVPDPDEAAARALLLEAEGADIIDLGGESTRPGADPVSADEELRRVMPVLDRIASRVKVPVSIDTYKGVVARAALDAGASIVNDISGLKFDPELAGVAAAGGAALVLMHTRGRPKSMAGEAKYDDVVAEVVDELQGSMAAAERAGVERSRVIVDPGIGFAKRPEHSYGVLARLPEIATALDRPLLVGASRKSFLRGPSHDRPAVERDWATAGAVAAAVLGGAHIVRVHAVAEMAQVVRVADEVRARGRESGFGIRDWQ